MGKVVELGGITKLDLPADRILENNKGRFESVVILAFDKDGNECFQSSIADGGTVIWLLERAKMKLLEVVDEYE